MKRGMGKKAIALKELIIIILVVIIFSAIIYGLWGILSK